MRQCFLENNKGLSLVYTIIVLKILAIEAVLTFVSSMVTVNMGQAIHYYRRQIMRLLWGVTGYALIGAIFYDLYLYFEW